MDHMADSTYILAMPARRHAAPCRYVMVVNVVLVTCYIFYFEEKYMNKIVIIKKKGMHRSKLKMIHLSSLCLVHIKEHGAHLDTFLLRPNTVNRQLEEDILLLA